MSSDNSHDNNDVGPSTGISTRISKSISHLLGGAEFRSVKTELTISEACHLLKNDRRRAAIRVLDERGQLAIGDLAEAVARRTEADCTGDARKRAYIALYQQHLDPLCESGVVASVGRDTYRLGPEAPAALLALESLGCVLGGGDA